MACETLELFPLRWPKTSSEFNKLKTRLIQNITYALFVFEWQVILVFV